MDEPDPISSAQRAASRSAPAAATTPLSWILLLCVGLLGVDLLLRVLLP